MQFINLWNITKIKTWKLDANAKVDWWQYPFFTCAREISWIDKPTYDCECVLVAGNGDLNVKYYHGKFDAYQRTYIIESNDTQDISMKYLYYFMQSYLEKLRSQTIGGVIQYIKMNNLTDIQIPLPSLEVQKSIVAKLDKLTELIDLKKEAIGKTEELTKSVFLEMFGNVSRNEKGYKLELFWDILSIDAKMVSPLDIKYQDLFCIGWANIVSETWDLIYLNTAKQEWSISGKFLVSPDDILYSKIRPKLKKITFPQIECLCSADIYPLRPNKKRITHHYLIEYLLSSSFTAIVSEMAEKRAQIPKINREELLNLKIPVPPLELQVCFEGFINSQLLIKKNQEKSLLKLQALNDTVVQQIFA